MYLMKRCSNSVNNQKNLYKVTLREIAVISMINPENNYPK